MICSEISIYDEFISLFMLIFDQKSIDRVYFSITLTFFVKNIEDLCSSNFINCNFNNLHIGIVKNIRSRRALQFGIAFFDKYSYSRAINRYFRHNTCK